MNGEPPCNVKFCFEGEEEVGSPHLEEYVSKNPDLFKSDAVIWEYGKIGSDGRPVVGLGVKGMIYLELTVRSLSQDAHSMYAAALPSAGVEAHEAPEPDQGLPREDPHPRVV